MSASNFCVKILIRFAEVSKLSPVLPLHLGVELFNTCTNSQCSSRSGVEGRSAHLALSGAHLEKLGAPPPPVFP